MKILKTFCILAIVATLMIGGTSSVFAKGKPDEPPGQSEHSPGKRGLFGTVTSVDTIGAGEEYIIHLETNQGPVAVTINGEPGTKYKVPREIHGQTDLAGFLDIVDENDDEDLNELEGSRIAALVSFVSESEAQALKLMLIPVGPPSHAHRVGIVTAFTPYTPDEDGDDGSIEIIDKDGVPHTFVITDDTVYRPDEISEKTPEELEEELEGGCVTIVTTGDPKLEPPAKAIVLHDELPDWAGGKIIVIKEIAGYEESDWSFEFTVTDDDYDESFSLSDDEKKYNSGWLEAGEYTVAELLDELPDEWDLTDIEIEDPSEDSSKDLEEGEAYINLAARETVTVTFTNTFTEPT